jgi:hypothetical protein
VNWARAYFGFLIVAVGAVLLLDQAGVMDAGDTFATWWPVALIGAGLLGFAADTRHWLMPAILGGAGAMLLLRTTGVVDTFAVIFPLVLIGIGLMVAFGWGVGSRREVSDDNSISSFNVFSGSEIASHSAAFVGGKVGAVFGGANIDLADARPAPGAALDVFVAFGGVEIRVPPGWRVDIGGFPIFGGYENITTKESLAPDAPRLRIDATVLFGGLEVKH